jgi:hypothetical protein
MLSILHDSMWIGDPELRTSPTWVVAPTADLANAIPKTYICGRCGIPPAPRLLMMFRPSRSLPLVAAFLLLAGCASPTEEESDDQNGAVTAGAANVSPITNGVYDGRDQTVQFLTPAGETTQRVVIADKGGVQCTANVDVNVGSGALKMVPVPSQSSPSCKGQLRNIMTGAAVDLLDIVQVPGSTIPTGRFNRRQDDALRATYRGDGVELHIRASTDASVDFELVSGGKSVSATATNDGGLTNDFESAESLRFRVIRTKGEFAIELGQGRVLTRVASSKR